MDTRQRSQREQRRDEPQRHAQRGQGGRWWRRGDGGAGRLGARCAPVQRHRNGSRKCLELVYHRSSPVQPARRPAADRLTADGLSRDPCAAVFPSFPRNPTSYDVSTPASMDGPCTDWWRCSRDWTGGGRVDRRRPAEGRLASHHRRRHLDALLRARPDHRLELQHPEGGVGVERHRRAAGRGDRRDQRPRPADLRRRHADHGVGPAPHGGVAGSGHRQDAVDVPGADHAAPRLLDALESRQGRGLSPHQRPRRGAGHHPGLLRARARRQDRQADRRLGRGGAGGRLRQVAARSTC